MINAYDLLARELKRQVALPGAGTPLQAAHSVPGDAPAPLTTTRRAVSTGGTVHLWIPDLDPFDDEHFYFGDEI